MRPKLLIPTLLLAFATGACSFFTTAAAVVDGHPISVDDLQARVASTMQQNPSIDASAAGRQRVERAVLVELIKRQLLREEAASVGVTVSDADVKQRFDELKQQYPNLEQQIQQAGVTIAQVNDDIRDQITVERLAARSASVTDAQVQAEYKRTLDQYRQIKVKHILIATSSRSDAAARSRARDALARLNAGESFAAVAKAMSDDPGSKDQGGELGQLVSLSQLDAAFAKAAWAAKIGVVTGPVKSSFGYHLIVTEQKTTQPLSAVAASIRSQLEQNASQGLAQEVAAKRLPTARVVVNPRFGDWDPSTGQIVGHEFFVPPATDPNIPNVGSVLPLAPSP